MIRKAVRLDNLAAAHVKRLAQAMGTTESEAIRTIIHRDRHVSALQEAMAVQVHVMQKAIDGNGATPPPEGGPQRGTGRTHAGHKR